MQYKRIADRFGNAIQFEWNGGSLRRIIGSNNTAINLATTITANQRTTTITNPDDGVFTINSSRIPGFTFPTDFQVQSVRNQVGATTSFSYDVDQTQLLLRQAIYQSGAQLHFNYQPHNMDIGGGATRRIFRVQRRYVREPQGNGTFRNVLQADFIYTGAQIPGRWSGFMVDNAYSVQVTEQNGPRRNYFFNNRNLLSRQETRNGTTLVSEQTTAYNAPLTRLPTQITKTERQATRSSITTTSYIYNNFGQVIREVSPLAGNSTDDRYHTNYTYDDRFGLLTIKTYNTNNTTSVVETNTLSGNGNSITRYKL